MIASAGASRNMLGWRAGSIRSAPPAKRMKAGSLAASVTSATADAPVPSVSRTAAWRLTASRALASAVAGEEALSSTTSLSGLGPALSRTPPRRLVSSTARCAPFPIDVAIHGSVETGALTTTGTSSPPPQPASATAVSKTSPSRFTLRHDGGNTAWVLEGFSTTARPASLAALLFAVLALLVAACGGDDTEGGNSGAQPTVTTPAATATEAAGESEAEKKKEKQEAKENGGKDCDEIAALKGKPKKKLPSDVPLLEGARVYQSKGPFGKTTQYFAVVRGDAEELAEKRDEATDALVKAGYKKLATDQEEGTEAEAHLSGPHSVDLQVINLCAGKLRVRYTVG